MVGHSGRATPIPPDIFSDEELTEHLRDVSKCAKKTTKRPKWKETFTDAEVTDSDCFSASEYDLENSSYECDFDGMPANFRILSRDSVKPLAESSDEDEMPKESRRGGVSGVSDLELTSDEDELPYTPRSKSKPLKVVKMIFYNTEVEDLSGDERPQKPKRCAVRPRTGTFLTNELLDAKAPGKAEVTDVEDLSEGCESEAEPDIIPARVLTPVKNLNYGGVVTGKIRKFRSSDSSTVGVPKIIVSYIDNEEKLKEKNSCKSPTEDAEPQKSKMKESNHPKPKIITDNSKKNHNGSGKRRESIKKEIIEEQKLQAAVCHGEPSDSECTFLSPTSAEKKKRKSKKIKRRKDPAGETDVEELGNSDRESDRKQQETTDGGQTDLEDIGFLSDSEDEIDKKAKTDAEDFETSGDDSKSLTSHSSGSVLYEGSLVHIENRMQTNWDTPEELIHTKNYVECNEVHTDVENIDLPEGEKPKKPARKRRDGSFGIFENGGSKSNFYSYVTLGGSRRLSEQKEEKYLTKKWEDVRKEWSEKGQSEEYAYETKDVQEPVGESLERITLKATKTLISKQVKPPNGSKTKPSPSEKAEILHSLCDLLVGKPSAEPQSKYNPKVLTDFEEVYKEHPLTPEEVTKCEVFLHSEPESRKSELLESDEFEQMLLDQGIISVAEYKQKIKLLEPSEQEFDKILEETYKQYPDDFESKTVVVNQREGKLTPSEVKTLEEILKTHGIEEGKHEIPKTKTEILHIKSKPNWLTQMPEGSVSGGVVTFNKQCKQRLLPTEVRRMEEILKTHRLEEIPKPGNTVVINKHSQQKLTPKEIKQIEAILRTHRADEISQSPGKTMKAERQGTLRAQKSAKTKMEVPFPPVDVIKTTYKYQQKQPNQEISIRYKTKEFADVRSPAVPKFPTGEPTKVERKPKLEKILRDDGLIHTEECDEYCNYIKRMERDSFELENHLKALRLVDTSPKKYLEESTSTRKGQKPSGFNSSIDDFILKLNAFDFDRLLCESHRRKIARECSRSLDDLSEKSMDRETLRKASIPGSTLTECHPSHISRLLVNGRKIESFSKSVLDLRKVGLPQKSRITNIREEDEKANLKRNPSIELLIRKVDPGRSAIEIRSAGRESHRPEYSFLDRRCSEVFGQRADSSPFVDEPAKPMPMTLSLLSLEERKKKNSQRKYDKLQSMECLIERREIASELAYTYSRPQKSSMASKTKPSSSGLSINRLYVHTPFDRQFRDFTQEKMPKSILKKTSSFQPKFESVSLLSLKNDPQGSPPPTRDHKICIEKSLSCESISTGFKYVEGRKMEYKKGGGKLQRTSSWNKFEVPLSPLSQNRSVSSNSLSDSQVDSDSSRVSASTNPPATLIRYVTPGSKTITFVKPYVDYYDWSKQEISEDDVNLSELECPNVQSDDSEFADRSFGYFYKEKPTSD